MPTHEFYMQKAIDLSQQNWWQCMPNPSVGAVLVYNNEIIGQGCTQAFGCAHAEVMCIESVLPIHQKNIAKSTLYVTLEPCSHTGKTPPCVDLIIANKIPKIIIGTKDIFNKVNGSGIKALQNIGVEVQVNILQEKCVESNKRFFVFHKNKTPYIILKWAQTADGFIARENKKQLQISNSTVNTEVHTWRSQEMAILVGVNTVLQDNPHLNVRHVQGKNPIRIVWDEKNVLENSACNLLDNKQRTLVYNNKQNKTLQNTTWIKVNSLAEIMHNLYLQNIQSVLIEGGAKTLQKCIDQNLWHEARIITAPMNIEKGYSAPIYANHDWQKTIQMDTDAIDFYTNKTLLLI